MVIRSSTRSHRGDAGVPLFSRGQIRATPLRSLLAVSIALLFVAENFAFAVDIEGVQPAALDQPRVHIHLRREMKGRPLSTGGGKGAEQTIDAEAFLDTGASGVMISTQSADALGITRETVVAGAAAGKAKAAVFHDVGVGGGDEFNISEPLFVFVAPYSKNGEPADASLYPISFGPVRAQVGPLSGGIMAMLTGGLDVVGMPAIKDHVIVIDPKPVDTFADTMRAALVEKGARSIPQTDRHVKVTFKSFARFTSTEPAGADGPTLADNPFIAAVSATRGDKHADGGSWLLDTGAAASMISKAQAEKLGVRYVDGTEGGGSPKLEGVADDQQFTLTIGGVGGSKKAAGFFLDTLVLPTRENDPLVYRKAPVFVTDITVEDPKTKEKLTLDGVFGMNFLTASAYITEAALLPDIGKMSQGAFEWIVFDPAAAELGVKLKKDLTGGAPADAGKIEIKPTRKPVKR